MNEDKITEVKRGEIYYVNLDPVVGSEQAGTRPVVCIQNNVGNKCSPTVIIAVITSKKKSRQPTHVKINTPGLPRKSTVMLEQVQTVDKQRLIRFVGTLNDDQMREIDRALDISLGREGRSK